MDNKYANLPGIARNEPDVYETSNVASSVSSKYETVEDDSKNVQKINVNLKEAFEKFNARTLNTDFADFSDSITNRRKFGYLVEPDIYEWNQDPVESPLQRFKRLEKELNELKKDLTEMNKFASEEDKKQLLNFNPLDLVKQVEALHKQVNSLHLETIGANKSESSLIENKDKKQLLLDHLDEFKKNLSTKEKNEPKETARNDSSIVYKLFADMQTNDLQKSNKISELNQRLSNLEKVFGAGNAAISERQINTLCNNIENKSILGFVEHLNTKLNLMDQQYVEQIESRLQVVSSRLNQLNEKKHLLEEGDKLNRVNELYSMVSKWKDVSSTVPALVQRLAALHEIHQKVFEFPHVVARLDAEQQTIKQRLDNGADVLDKLKKSLEQNLDSIRNNFEALNERIQNVQKQ